MIISINMKEVSKITEDQTDTNRMTIEFNNGAAINVQDCIVTISSDLEQVLISS